MDSDPAQYSRLHIFEIGQFGQGVLELGQNSGQNLFAFGMGSLVRGFGDLEKCNLRSNSRLVAKKWFNSDFISKAFVLGSLMERIYDVKV